jgi:hypothetical protein
MGIPALAAGHVHAPVRVAVIIVIIVVVVVPQAGMEGDDRCASVAPRGLGEPGKILGCAGPVYQGDMGPGGAGC